MCKAAGVSTLRQSTEADKGRAAPLPGSCPWLHKPGAASAAHTNILAFSAFTLVALKVLRLRKTGEFSQI